MRKTLCVTCCGTILLVGCMSVGVPVDPQRLTQFQPGVTLCAEIVQPRPSGLGTPTTMTTQSNGSRQLVYTYQHSQVDAGAVALAVLGVPAGRTTTEQTNVVLECDTAGVLRTYSSTQGQIGVGMGVTGGAKH